MSILILLLSTSLGCPILNELDNANAQMDKFAKKGKDEKIEQPAASKPSDEGDGVSVERKLQQWWKEARSLDTKELSPGIVSCRVGTSVQFMARDECLNRGGKPGRAS